MQKWNFGVIALLGLLLMPVHVMASSPGMISSSECSQNCRDAYESCKKTETEEKVMKDFSCFEIREMCMDRCRNITGYVPCKDKCHGDPQCLERCKDQFQDNVQDYKPILDRRSKIK
ncbi:MAG: hypothetical protein GX751_10655 [Desulfuromonadaceae bacterium]|nr:hypothetical protein [Desulfuromonadaceae bacterium]